MNPQCVRLDRETSVNLRFERRRTHARDYASLIRPCNEPCSRYASLSTTSSRTPNPAVMANIRAIIMRRALDVRLTRPRGSYGTSSPREPRQLTSRQRLRHRRERCTKSKLGARLSLPCRPRSPTRRLVNTLDHELIPRLEQVEIQVLSRKLRHVVWRHRQGAGGRQRTRPVISKTIFTAINTSQDSDVVFPQRVSDFD